MSMLTLDAPSGRASQAGWWTRLRRFIQEGRRRKADEFIQPRTHLLPNELEHAAYGLTSRSEPTLPFRR
jgi:hypothetical protein